MGDKCYTCLIEVCAVLQNRSMTSGFLVNSFVLYSISLERVFSVFVRLPSRVAGLLTRSPTCCQWSAEQENNWEFCVKILYDSLSID